MLVVVVGAAYLRLPAYPVNHMLIYDLLSIIGWGFLTRGIILGIKGRSKPERACYIIALVLFVISLGHSTVVVASDWRILHGH